MSFGRRINTWLAEAPGRQFTDNKWRFWFLPLCGFQLLNATLTAAVFSAGGQLQNAMGAVVLGVGALLAWLAVAFLHYSDSTDRQLARGVSILDSVTLIAVLCHFAFLLWTFGHLKTIQAAETKYEAQTAAFNAQARELQDANVKIAEAARAIAAETTKAERLRNDTAYQQRKAAEAGMRAARSSAKAEIAPASGLQTSQVELERPTRPDETSAAFLARWDFWIRAANLAELLLAAITLIAIRVQTSRTNDGAEYIPLSTSARSRAFNPAFETTRSDTVSFQSDDTAPVKKATRVVNREGLKRLRETLKLIGFHSRTHFKVDPKDAYLWIRQFKSRAGEAETIASARAKLKLLDSALRLDPETFRREVTLWLEEHGFDV